MKFFKKKIKVIKSIPISFGFIYLNENEELFINDRLIDTNVQDFKTNHIDLAIQKSNELVLFQLIDSAKVVFNGVFFLNHSWWAESFYILKEEYDNDYYYRLNNLMQLEKIKWENNYIKLIIHNYFFSLIKNIFYAHNIKDGAILWQQSYLDLLEGIEIHQYGNIVVHNDILYIYLADNKDGRNFATVAIDILTGEKINTYTGFGGDLFLYGDKIGVASSQKAQILNTITKQISEYNLSGLLEKDKLNIIWNSFILTEGDTLYFIADDHRQGSHIGIINLVENELVWLYDVNGNKDLYDISVRSIKLSAGRLYAHCSDQTLRIFE